MSQDQVSDVAMNDSRSRTRERFVAHENIEIVLFNPGNLMTAEETKTEVQESAPEQTAQPAGPRFPSMMLILTFLFISGVFLAFYFASEIDDRFAVGLDIITVASVASGAVVLILWVGWILVFSRWKLLVKLVASIAMIAAPFVATKVLRPVLGGDVTIQRFDPIWSSKPEAPAAADAASSGDVDLLTETPHDFSRFLGPNQDSTITTGIEIDGAALAKAKVLWKQPIGLGWSGFVARNGFAVTMEQRQAQECVSCYNIEDGSLQWMHQHPVRHRDKLNLGRIGPRATPTIHEGRVYSVGAVGHLVCLNGADGNVEWEVDLNELLGLEVATDVDRDGQTVHFEGNSRLEWGRSGSPLIFEDLIILPGGGPNGGPISTLLAFDRVSGELRWKGGSEMIAYGSPTLATIAGVEQILMTGESLAMGFNPRTGEQLWEYSRPGNTGGEANTSQLTVVSANSVLTSKGYHDGGGRLIELTSNDGKLVPESKWFNSKSLKTKLMSPVIHEGHAYSLSNGFLECVRLSDGERLWKHRGHFGHGQMLLVAGQLLVNSESGELYAFDAAADSCRELGRVHTVDGVCWNTLCLYGNKLLVRSEIEAACLELPTR